MEPPDDANPIVWTYRHQHPVGSRRRRFRDHAALRFSDLVPRWELRATDLYNLFYRPLGIEYQPSIGVKLTPTWVLCVQARTEAAARWHRRAARDADPAADGTAAS